MGKEIEGVKQMEADELLKLYDNKPQEVELIDVREPEEYEAGHIPGIKLIPMGEIPEQMEKLDKNKEYVFVCRSGRRSHEVCKFLQAHGFARVFNFDGGMLEWPGPMEFGKEK